jgi:hypothetical protein
MIKRTPAKTVNPDGLLSALDYQTGQPCARCGAPAAAWCPRCQSRCCVDSGACHPRHQSRGFDPDVRAQGGVERNGWAVSK